MKRYQCTKSIRHELFEFKPGTPYDFNIKHTNMGVFYGHATIVGRIIWLKEAQIRDHFQELLDLNLDDERMPHEDPDATDHDRAEYERFLYNDPGCKRAGVAICIVAASIIAVFIYKAITWGS